MLNPVSVGGRLFQSELQKKEAKVLTGGGGSGDDSSSSGSDSESDSDSSGDDVRGDRRKRGRDADDNGGKDRRKKR